jgi:GT2 family glycosyltransferase
MPNVAVVIALYNKGPYVARALDSVLGQTYEDFELIVVDDGSTDEGPGVVSIYKDPRIRLIRQENAGPGAARNRGVRESAAPYLAFLDADDEWLPEFLRVSIESLEMHPQCSVAVTSRYEGPLRTDMTPVHMRRGLRAGEWSLSQDACDAALRRRGPMLWTGAVVCRRTAFERLGGFYDKNHALIGEDAYLWIQLALNCRIFAILRPLVWYHTEVSDLGWRWKDAGFLHPQLSDPELIRRNCPPEYRRLLEEYLVWRAFQRVADLCACEDVAAAAQLDRKSVV